MAESDDGPRRFTKAWVRDNWDEERGTARKSVQVVKLVHEWHILGLGVVIVPVGAFWLTGAPSRQVLASFVGTAGTASALFFQQFWCSTLARTTDDADEE